MIIMSEARKEIIQVFMKEAKKKHTGLNWGFKPEYQNALGLVETAVAFEAFINELKYEKIIKIKLDTFSDKYQKSFEKYKKGLDEEINALKQELEIMPLDDMTPNTTRTAIEIIDSNNLNEIITVVYSF